LVPGLSLG